jgi:hypothetical protein
MPHWGEGCQASAEERTRRLGGKIPDCYGPTSRRAAVSFNQQLYQQRSYTVEPMQGLIKNIFELERCWMRGNENNRWLFAAMGVAVQMHQFRAWEAGRSTWTIKQEVLGR